MKTLFALGVLLSFGPHIRSEPTTTTNPPFVHPPGEYIAVDGAKLWVEAVGAGEPILLIAGGPGCSHGYLHPSFDALSATHRVIYFDAFGRGKSDRAKDPSAYTLDRDVSEIVGLIRELKLGPLVVLGHSYGTIVAQAVAVRHPEVVKKLVLISPLHSAEAFRVLNVRFFGLHAEHYPEEWARLLALRDRGLRWAEPECLAISDKLAVGLKSYFDASSAARSAPLFDYNNTVLYAMIGDTWEPDIIGTLAGFDFRPQLADLRMPMLVMAGRWADITMPSVTIPYREFAPQAQFVMLEHSGHQPFLEEPELALATLRAFVDR